MKKKLVICGCSFSAASKEFPDTSYGELLAQQLDWELVQLARPGCSNGGIRLQIDEVIRQKPDFAIIAPTFHDRMEIPAKVSNSVGYQSELGIKNVNYGKQPYSLICEPIASLAENYLHSDRCPKLDSATQQAVKSYVSYLYDSNWKLQIDTWIMRDGIVQAYAAGIKFIVLPDNLWSADTVRNIIPSFIPDKYLITKNEMLPQHATWLYPVENKDPGYHGSPKSQQYLANIFYEIIKQWDSDTIKSYEQWDFPGKEISRLPGQEAENGKT
jgi:hypothetical protein